MLNRMSHSTCRHCGVLGISLVLALMGFGCEGERPARSEKARPTPAKLSETGQTQNRPPADAAQAIPTKSAESSKKVLLGRSVWFETEGDRRRVLVESTVCLREGGLECLLCRSRTKEHESILATDADAEVIHAALLAAGAQPGAPVQYVEKQGEVVILPPTGSHMRISLRYENASKTVTVPAQQWILNAKTNKDLADEWVFAGSRLLPSLENENQKPIYAATSDGSYICVYNMPYAMLDLPVNNPNKDPEIRELQPQTDRIPPLGTKVILIIEPKRDDEHPG